MKNVTVLVMMVISLLSFSGVASASYTEVTWMKGTLKQISVYNSTTGEWKDVFKGSQVIDLNTNALNFKANIQSGNLTAGTYTKVRFAFANQFEMAGKVVLDDGTIYYSEGGNITDSGSSSVNFKKSLSTEGKWILTIQNRPFQSDGDDFTTWCENSIYYTEDDSFHAIIDEKNGQPFHWYIQKGWLWSDNGDKEYFSGTGDFTLSGDMATLQAPFIDGFEVDWEN